MRGYIRSRDTVNYRLGRLVCNGISSMVAHLLWSSVSKTFSPPRYGRWKWHNSPCRLLHAGRTLCVADGREMCGWICFYQSWDTVEKVRVRRLHRCLFLLSFLGVLLWGALKLRRPIPLAISGAILWRFYGDLVLGPFFLTGGPVGCL